MATAPPSKILQELEEVTRCPICLETYTDPRTLPCLHVMCHKCIQDFIQTAISENLTIIRCPMCSRESKIPTPPEEYPVSFVTNSLVDILNQTRSSGTAKCQPCSEEGEDDQATWICTHCGELMCPVCKKYHNRQEKDHLCLEVANLTADNIKEISAKKTLHYCNKHQDNKLDYLCVDCGELLCVACKLTGKTHKDHETVYVKDTDVVQSHKQIIQDFNNKCETLIQQYTTCLDEVKQKENAKDKDIEECINQVEQRHQEMQKALLKHKEDLIKQAEDVRKEYHATAKAKTTKLEKEVGEVKATLRNIKQIENEGTYIDIVSCSINEIKQNYELVDRKPSSFMHNPRLTAKFEKSVSEVTDVFGHLKLSSSCSITSHIEREFTTGGHSLPTGLALTQKNNVIVGYQNTNTVEIYTQDGSLLSTLDKHGTLQEAFDVAHHEGCTYVSDRKTGKIHVYGEDYKYCKTIETTIPDDDFPGITAFKDNLYISNKKGNQIHCISMKEPHRETIKTCNEITVPWFVDTDGEILVVSCLRTPSQVVVCDLEGNFMHQHGGLNKESSENQLQRAYGVLIGDFHHIVIADSEHKRLVVLSDVGKVCSVIPLEGKPYALAKDKDHNIVVTTYNPNKVITIKYKLVE